LKLFNPLCTKETNIKRHMILLRTMWSCSWIAIFLMFYDTVNGNASSINLNKITKTMSVFFLCRKELIWRNDKDANSKYMY
jgi:hypothetical protein